MKKHLFHKGTKVGIGDKARGKKLLTSLPPVNHTVYLTTWKKISNIGTIRRQNKNLPGALRIRKSFYALQ